VIRLEISTPLEPEAAFDVVVEELRAVLPHAPLRTEPNRLVVEWEPVEWAPGRPRAEVRVEPGRIAVELTGWDDVLSVHGRREPELVAWFAQAVAAAAIRSGSPASLAEWLVDRGARRPAGAHEREQWSAMHEERGGAHRAGFDAILAALSPGPNDYLLDVGCGSGFLVRLALESGCRAAAVDHSADMVRVTRERNADAVTAGRLDVAVARAEELPFADGTFTRVAIAHAFFFLNEPVRALEECRRVLGERGRLAVFTSGPELKGHPEAAPEPYASAMHFYEPEELERLARDAGFSYARVDADGQGGQLLVADR
jgi:SAM-dependent methyltransferase